MTSLAYPPAIAIPERQLPFFKGLKTMLDNPMEGWPRAVYEQSAWSPPRRDFPRLYVCDPDALKTILLDDIEDFPKSPVSQRLLRPMLGDGLLTADFSAWRWQRRAAAPAFQAEGVSRSLAVVGAIAERASQRLLSDDGERDLSAEMMRVTFDVILETMLGGAEHVDAGAMSQQFALYMHHLGRPSLADVLGAPTWLRTALCPSGAGAVRYMREAVAAMIARRRASPPEHDLVDLLLTARDVETDRPMSDREIQDNLLTFLAAGHETTALALTWSLFLLSQHGEAAVRVAEEARACAPTGPLDAGAAGRLPFTRQVLFEAMRLYPPAPVLTRVAARDRELAGHRVRRGESIVIPVYALHRHRRYWADPDRFDPERFNEANAAHRKRFTYLPFGGGRRICLGMAFALSEAAVVLATLMRDGRFTLRPEFHIRPLLRITMRPEGGLPMRVRPRA